MLCLQVNNTNQADRAAQPQQPSQQRQPSNIPTAQPMPLPAPNRTGEPLTVPHHGVPQHASTFMQGYCC